MIASLIALLNLLLATAEFAPAAGSPLLAVVFAAAIVVTVAVVLVVLPALLSAVRRPDARPIDPSAPLAQSDPDAAGHPRPRAPGLVARAA